MPFSRPIGIAVVPAARNTIGRRVNVSVSTNAGQSIGGGRNIVAGRIAATVRHRLMIINTVTEIGGYAHQARCGEGVARSHDRTLMLRFDCFHWEP